MKVRHRILKLLFLWFCMGGCYLVLELAWRLIWRRPITPYVLLMLPVGGLCGLAVGSINQWPRFYNMKVLHQSIMGTALTLLIEFVAGYILNIRLGLGIWDYSHAPLNLMGQICLPFAFLWLFIMPLAIWLEDHLRYVWWKEGDSYGLGKIYMEFRTFQ